MGKSYSGTMPYSHPYYLTEREKEVLQHVSRGYTNTEIAQTLNLSQRTVEKYREILLMKAQSRNTAHLITRAFQYGWLKK